MTTMMLKSEKIVNLSLNKNSKFLYVSFEEGSIEIYDLGDNFSSKPLFLSIQNFDMKLYQGVLIKSYKFLFSHDNGFIAFVYLNQLELFYS